MIPKITWPEGKKFAFTIFDDTDAASVERLQPVYALLRDLGMRTTKSVWPIKGAEQPLVVGGATCEEAGYLEWVLALQREGFEIGFHNATYHSSSREDTLRGLDTFRRIFGHEPRSMANHTICQEGIYWGEQRVTGAHRLLYNLLTRFRQRGWFRGHVVGDPFFWGDLCRERIQYVRNFVFADINTLKVCPWMPYHDATRPYVNAWYASAEGANASSFIRTISEANQDQLEAEGGACIMYTHLAKAFCAGGVVDKEFARLMTRLAAKPGWFVPVSTLLDHLAKVKGVHALTPADRAKLERRWLRHKLFVGTT
jgi:hypothetical protein